MRYIIDEENKKITFECEVLVLVELAKCMDKLVPVYPDIKKWSIASQESFSQSESITEHFTEDVPEKPLTPDFDFDNNSLPEDEGHV